MTHGLGGWHAQQRDADELAARQTLTRDARVARAASHAANDAADAADDLRTIADLRARFARTGGAK